MNEVKNMSKKSWHYKIADYFYSTWNIDSVCEYWIKVYSAIIACVFIPPYTVYGVYLWIDLFKSDLFTGNFFDFGALICSLAIITISFVIIMSVATEYFSDKIKNCKKIHFIDEE